MLSLKFILAFCGLSYELILAQGLSAFLDNTVLRYCTTIGLYMFAMGLGSLASARLDTRRPALVLWQAEVLLAWAGAGSIVSLFIVSGLNLPVFLVVIWAYFLVALIGFLTGLELPLMLLMAGRSGQPSRSGLIAIDYAGACVATLVFVFYFYPTAGLVRAVFQVVVLNALAAVAVSVKYGTDLEELRGPALAASLALLGGATAVLAVSTGLEKGLLAFYLGAVN
ncbi:MAG: hypothetical protein HQL20_02610 [Candidatus Omnitrophica bacterium]|nr:hypothetical protein [Candidatus Omnitrophota bacterium]